MSCSRPLPLIRGKKPQYDAFGRRIYIPCRSCECCRTTLRNMWKERSLYEQNHHRGAAFVTFTYDNENLPVISGYKRPTLDFDHVHKYIDSIRHRAKVLFKKYPLQYSNCDLDFTYIGCGEYGDKFKRPHYHIIFFGLDYKQCRRFLSKSWKYGSIEVDPLKNGGIGYVLKYLQKQVFGKLKKDLYILKGRVAPKLFYSRGLGSNLYYEHRDNYLKNGYIRFGSHKRVYPPPYYANKLDLKNEDYYVEKFQKQNAEIRHNYDRYVHLGGKLTLNEWTRQNRIDHERRLFNVKFKDDYCEIPLYLLNSDRSIRKSLSDLVDKSIEALYNDKVPF